MPYSSGSSSESKRGKGGPCVTARALGGNANLCAARYPVGYCDGEHMGETLPSPREPAFLTVCPDGICSFTASSSVDYCYSNCMHTCVDSLVSVPCLSPKEFS
ncbi:MAG: hypothetical protein WCN92_11210 [Eubacteriales bacterium]